MAYKFQIGGAKLSGSITQTDGTFITAQSELRIGDAQLTEVELEKLDGITNGSVAGNKAVVVDGNRDASNFRNVGAVQLSASADVLVGGNITGSGGITLLDATGIAGTGLEDDTEGKLKISDAGVTTAMLANLTRGAVLIGNSSNRPEALDGSTANRVLFTDGTDLTFAQVPNLALANDGITIGTSDTSLGDTITAIVGLTDLDLAAGNRTIFDTVGANTLTLGAATTTVRVAGDFEVAGTLNTVSETELVVEDKTILIASGS